jgi:hypothetical protein
MNPIFMDPYEGLIIGNAADPRWELIRTNIGYMQKYAGETDLNKMVPTGHLASTGYCLANPGSDYIVYLPDTNKVTLDLSDLKNDCYLEWLDPETGEIITAGSIRAGGTVELETPGEIKNAVLYITTKKKLP